jgi:hypothetical protein
VCHPAGEPSGGLRPLRREQAGFDEGVGFGPTDPRDIGQPRRCGGGDRDCGSVTCFRTEESGSDLRERSSRLGGCGVIGSGL